MPMRLCPHCGFRGVEQLCPHDGFPLVDERVFEKNDAAPSLVGRVFGGRYRIEKLGIEDDPERRS